MSTKIASLLFLLVCVIASANRCPGQNEAICGSVTRFKETQRWQDLPGCTDKRDYSNDLSPVSLLGSAKDHFRDFFTSWEKGEFERVDTFANDCYGFINSYNANAWNSERELVAARPAYEEMKKTVKKYMEWVPVLHDVAQAYYNTVTRVEATQNGETRNSDLAQTFARELQEGLKRAASAQVPDNLLIPGVGNAKTATIGEIKEMLPSFLGQANKGVEQAKAEENAEYEPFRKVLSGDKLSLYNKRLKIYQVYGAGGRRLKNPEDYKSSAVWCTSGVDRNGIIPRWEVDCWHFNGTVKVGEVIHRTGSGEDAPAGAFR